MKSEAGRERGMFKLALDAGHGINTPGKRCLKSLDPNETREWQLNSQIADKVEALLSRYKNVTVLRLDDRDSGTQDIPLETRVKAANKWQADFCLSIHHNAGVPGGGGGGIVAYCHPQADPEAFAWRDGLYDALVRHTGLQGNRATPKAEKDLFVLRKTTMPAVLLELGFMDSAEDVPVILTGKYADKCAEAIVETVAQRAGLSEVHSDPEQEKFNVLIERWLACRAKLPGNSWAKMDAARAAGITDGTRPCSYATREEVATMIMSAREKR